MSKTNASRAHRKREGPSATDDHGHTSTRNINEGQKHNTERGRIYNPADKRAGGDDVNRHRSRSNARQPKSGAHTDGEDTDNDTNQPSVEKSLQFSESQNAEPRNQSRRIHIPHIEKRINVAKELGWGSLESWEELLKELKDIDIEDPSYEEKAGKLRRSFLRSYIKEIENQMKNVGTWKSEAPSLDYDLETDLYWMKQELGTLKAIKTFGKLNEIKQSRTGK